MGDHPSITSHSNKLPIVFLSFRETASFLPGLEYFQETFRPFGKIVDILYRPSQLRDLKSYILIQMDTIEQAIAIKDFYTHPDQGSARRSAFGGTSLEINILSEPQEAGNAFSIIKPNISKYLGKRAQSAGVSGRTELMRRNRDDCLPRSTSSPEDQQVEFESGGVGPE